MKYLILLTLMSCVSRQQLEEEELRKNPNVRTWHCENIRFTNVTRCENKEVICYRHFTGGGMSCKWKEER